MSSPVLKAPDFNRDFFLYLAAAESTMGMVLVQESDDHMEHVVYYLSRALVGPELTFSHIEKLALGVVHAVQRLRHYLILRRTLVVANTNPFQYILTRRVIGGKYSKWIFILQEFELDFISAKSKKSLVFTELISELPHVSEDDSMVDTFVDEHLFLIDSSNLGMETSSCTSKPKGCLHTSITTSEYVSSIMKETI